MQNTTSDIKQVVVDISEKLWLQAKSSAALKNIPLKDFVANAIQEKLDRESTTQY
jgi:hypothetical protein